MMWWRNRSFVHKAIAEKDDDDEWKKRDNLIKRRINNSLNKWLKENLWNWFLSCVSRRLSSLKTEMSLKKKERDNWVTVFRANTN